MGAAPGPVAKAKWLTASVVDDAASVVGQIFDEAHRRDPHNAHTWVALVDGNRHQLRRIAAESKLRGVDVSVVIDFIHVLEYLWATAGCFHKEGDPAAEGWVRKHASAVLAGRATKVAGAIRRAATRPLALGTSRHELALGLGQPEGRGDVADRPLLLARQPFDRRVVQDGLAERRVLELDEVLGGNHSLRAARRDPAR
jgi:hypothetical protein